MEIRVFAGALSALLAAGCGGSSLCNNLCTPYIQCAQTAGSYPLFCDPPTTCQSICAMSSAALGDSEGAFQACGSCVLKYAADKVCDFQTAQQTGQIACADTCSSSRAANAASKFYDDFSTAIAATPPDSCAPGQTSWIAADSKLGQDGGNPGNGGVWICENNSCNPYHSLFGPWVSLPPGQYHVGARDLTGTLGSTDVIEIHATTDNGSNELAKASFRASDFAGGRLSAATVDFTITSVVRQFEIQVWIESGARVTVGSLFITRL